VAGGADIIATTAAHRPSVWAATSDANTAAGPAIDATDATRITMDEVIAATP
jgi:hypothetical protein